MNIRLWDDRAQIAVDGKYQDLSAVATSVLRAGKAAADDVRIIGRIETEITGRVNREAALREDFPRRAGAGRPLAELLREIHREAV